MNDPGPDKLAKMRRISSLVSDYKCGFLLLLFVCLFCVLGVGLFASETEAVF